MHGKEKEIVYGNIFLYILFFRWVDSSISLAEQVSIDSLLVLLFIFS